jgi:transposase
LILGVLGVAGMRKRAAQPCLVDDLWARVEPLIPQQRPRSAPGRRPVDDREVLRGMLFVHYTGIRPGMAAQRARPRLRHDLLAPAAGLERRRGAAAPS